MASPLPLAVDVSIDSTTWAALALVLTLVGLGLTYLSWRRRGVAAGLRALAWTLVPVAAWLTGTLRLVVAVVEDVANWAVRLAFSPTVWAGLVVAGVAVLLWFVSGRMLARGIGVRAVTGRRERAVAASGAAPASDGAPRKAPKQARPQQRDDDLEGMDDIEAILKKHGI